MSWKRRDHDTQRLDHYFLRRQAALRTPSLVTESYAKNFHVRHGQVQPPPNITGLRRITTFRSTTRRIYDGGLVYCTVLSRLVRYTFAQRNRPTTLFSERIPVVKRRKSVLNDVLQLPMYGFSMPSVCYNNLRQISGNQKPVCLMWVQTRVK